MSSIAAMPEEYSILTMPSWMRLVLRMRIGPTKEVVLAVQSAAGLGVQAEDLDHADDLARHRPSLVEAVAVQALGLVPLHELDVDLEVLQDDPVDLPLQLVALLRRSGSRNG